MKAGIRECAIPSSNSGNFPGGDTDDNMKEKRGADMGHDADCDCGCNTEEREEMTVTLTLDDDTEMECVVLTIFTAGERDYIALLPIEGEEAEEGEVYLYRYSESKDGEPNLENIEDDDEYEIVADAFDELLDSQEYDELVGEDE